MLQLLALLGAILALCLAVATYALGKGPGPALPLDPVPMPPAPPEAQDGAEEPMPAGPPSGPRGDIRSEALAAHARRHRKIAVPKAAPTDLSTPPRRP